MATITGFLLARIAEDEELADQIERNPERPEGPVHVPGVGRVAVVGRSHLLAECEAKRRIVGRCRPQYLVLYRESDRLLAEGLGETVMPTVAHSGPAWPFDSAEAILRALALPYADHPDYQDEWCP